MNKDLIAVNVKDCTTYRFAFDEETAEELLQRANESKQKDIERYKEILSGEYTNDYFRDCLKSAEEIDYQVMSLDEFIKFERNYYINKPLKETTKEDFYEMLNVLPPLKWCTIDEVEMFCMSEMYTSTYTSQYARCNGKYYTKMVDCMDKSTWINNYLN